jgi:hypothetical protein
MRQTGVTSDQHAVFDDRIDDLLRKVRRVATATTPGVMWDGTLYRHKGAAALSGGHVMMRFAVRQTITARF